MRIRTVQLVDQPRSFSWRRAMPVIASVAVVGAVVLAATFAATAPAAFEAELGALTAGATSTSVTGASGGSVLKFGAGASTLPPTATMTMSLNGATKYQTMTAIGASINIHSWNNGALKPVIDMLIDQNGTKTFRVVMEMTDWEQANDNADSASYNWDYYNPIYAGTTSFDTAQKGSNFADLWSTIDYLHQRNIPDSQIILSFMGAGPSWLVGSNNTVTAAKEDEWAEMVTSAAYYGYSHNHTFGAFSPNNEEDIGRNEGISMTATVYAASMNKVATRLDALGLNNVRLVGPETSSTIASYVDAMAGYANVLSKTDHFDFHNYSGSTGGGSGVVDGYTGKDFWMSEFSQFPHVWNLLDQGASGLMMWEAYDSVYNHAIVNGLGSAPGNDIDPGNPGWIAYNATTKVYTPRKSFYQFGQLFKYTPLGSQMVDITTSKADVVAEAFVHPTTGAITIVGQNNTGSAQVIGGTLKNTPTTSVLHYTFTNGSSNQAAGPDITVMGGAFTVSVPAGTVFTLTTL